MDEYKKKRIEKLVQEADLIRDGGHVAVKRHRLKLEKEKKAKLRVAAQRQRIATHSAAIACEAEMDLARERYDADAKKTKDELLVSLQEQLEQATRDAGLPPDDPLNMDPLGASRKLRARGENNKVAKSSKRKNDVRWNHGYIFGAIFMRKAGYRIEGGEGGDGDQVTLRPDMANHDKYAIEMEWDALKRGKGKRSNGANGERRSVRQRSSAAKDFPD